MTAPAEPEQRNFKITDDLSSAKLRDWIEGVGFINTHYELAFIHRFAEARQHPYPPQCPNWTCVDHNDGPEWCCNRPPIAPPKGHCNADGICNILKEDCPMKKRNRCEVCPIPLKPPTQQRIADAIKTIEGWKNGLDYPDCPPGDAYGRVIALLRENGS